MANAQDTDKPGSSGHVVSPEYDHDGEADISITSSDVSVCSSDSSPDVYTSEADTEISETDSDDDITSHSDDDINQLVSKHNIKAKQAKATLAKARKALADADAGAG
jgi:hypothetical protein